MLALSVNFLDGHIVRVEPGTACSIADVKAELKQKCDLPPMHEIKLFQGDRELTDTELIEVYLSAVATKSAVKAIERIGELIENWKNCHNDEQSDDDKATFDVAVGLLADSSCDRALCEQLLALLQSMSFHLTTEQKARLGAAFGCMCEDPILFVPCLLSLDDDVAMWAALAKIITRVSDKLSTQLREAIVNIASVKIEWYLGGHDLNLYHCIDSLYDYIHPVYHVLSQADAAACVKLLDRITVYDPCPLRAAAPLPLLLAIHAEKVTLGHNCSGCQGFEDASIASGSEQILKQKVITRYRADLLMQLRQAMPSTPSEEEAVAEIVSAPLAVEMGVSLEAETDQGLEAALCESERDALLQEQRHLENSIAPPWPSTWVPLEAETDQGLEAALCESERDALLQEQCHLQQAILYSKEESHHIIRNSMDEATDSGNGLALLHFNRFPNKFRAALLSSQLAARLTSCNVELEPEWAPGRLVLADAVTEVDVSEAREPWHVAVRTSDEDEVYATMRLLARDQRPRLKGSDGRFLVPKGDSLFEGSMECSITSKQEISDPFRNAVDWRELMVSRTFLHIPTSTVTLQRTSASAPPGM